MEKQPHVGMFYSSSQASRIECQILRTQYHIWSIIVSQYSCPCLISLTSLVNWNAYNIPSKILWLTTLIHWIIVYFKNPNRMDTMSSSIDMYWLIDCTSLKVIIELFFCYTAPTQQMVHMKSSSFGKSAVRLTMSLNKNENAAMLKGV